MQKRFEIQTRTDGSFDLVNIETTASAQFFTYKTAELVAAVLNCDVVHELCATRSSTRANDHGCTCPTAAEAWIYGHHACCPLA
jgi:hypothetical protein